MSNFNIINDFENAILAFISSMKQPGNESSPLFNIVEFSVDISKIRPKRWPSIMIATDPVEFEKGNILSGNLRSLSFKPTTHMIVLYRNESAVRKEKFRRHNTYPIVLALVKHIDGNKFGLDIDSVKVISVKEIITEETTERDIIAFDIAFTWKTEIEGNEDEYEDLLVIANKYFVVDGEESTEIVEDIVDVS